MATTATRVPTLLDVVNQLAPDGSQLDTAEVLTEHNEVLEEMTWREGNLLTGHRDSVRTTLPTPTFRAINEGVPLTKASSTQIEETCALLEDFSQVDRELAVLSGNVNAFRLREAKPHMIGMAHQMAETLFYGNANVNPKSFTGLAPRYYTGDAAESNLADYIIDGGGSGTGLRSIWLLAWSEDTITGIYPKNTIGGLHHEDATNAAGSGHDGIPAAAVLQDANNGFYMGFRDHWTWRCGLMVKDYRYAVRIANLDLDTLTNNPTSGDLQDFMVQALERIEMPSGTNLAFYMPRDIRSLLRRQMLTQKNAFMSWDEAGGKRVLRFSEAALRRVDALNVDETEVTGF
jgi:hypothetical protein